MKCGGPHFVQSTQFHTSYRNDPFGYDCAMHSNDSISPCLLVISSNLEYELTLGATLPIGSGPIKRESAHALDLLLPFTHALYAMHAMSIECWDK